MAVLQSNAAFMHEHPHSRYGKTLGDADDALYPPFHQHVRILQDMVLHRACGTVLRNLYIG